jgi:hypothetical protein
VSAVTHEGDIDISYTYEFKDEKNLKFPTKVFGKLNGQVLFMAEISY